jgi:aquaporin Z
MLLVLTVLGSTDVKTPVGFAGVAIGFVSGVDPSDSHSDYQRFRQSCTQHRFNGICWRLGIAAAVAFAPILGGVIAAAVYGLLHIPVGKITLRTAEESLPSKQVQRHDEQ